MPLGAIMIGSRYRSHRVCRAALVVLWILLSFWRSGSTAAAAQPTLQVTSLHGLLGLHHSELSRFLAAHMADVGLSDWRFEPPSGKGLAADRVEWSFKLNPFAGGGVKNIGGPSMRESRLGG